MRGRKGRKRSAEEGKEGKGYEKMGRRGKGRAAYQTFREGEGGNEGEINYHKGEESEERSGHGDEKGNNGSKAKQVRTKDGRKDKIGGKCS